MFCLKIAQIIWVKIDISPDIQFLQVLAVLDVRQGADGVHTRIDINILVVFIEAQKISFYILKKHYHYYE